jgi:DNA-binding CsgD family transcriptional regulator
LNKLSFSEIADGYFFDRSLNEYACIVCGRVFEVGEIFKIDERFFEADLAVKIHVESEHVDRIDAIINAESRYLSLTDIQMDVIRLFSRGYSDSEILEKLRITPTTVRNHRHKFNERAKSAKMFLFVWETASRGIVEKVNTKRNNLIIMPIRAGIIYKQCNITEWEYERIIKNSFESLAPMKLITFPVKEKKKIAIISKISEKFEPFVKYTENEVNEILSDIYNDYVTIRRYLIEYGFMSKSKDGNTYCLVNRFNSFDYE